MPGEEEEVSLELIPSGDDRAVQSFVGDLGKKLLLKQYNLSIKQSGLRLYIATLAMAMKSEKLIEVQNALLDVLKLCDTSSVMLQSFQSGAVNIVEKLKIAYLYLLDGFPEFAKTDIEAIGKDLTTMKNQADKARKATKDLRIAVEAIQKKVETELKENEKAKKELRDKIQKQRDRDIQRSSYQHGESKDTSRRRRGNPFLNLFRCCFGGQPEDPPAITGPGNGPREPSGSIYIKDEDIRPQLEKFEEDRELFELTRILLIIVVQFLGECDGFLDQLLKEVESWYLENKEVVTPSMDVNISRAEGMSEQDKKQYWESLMFKQEVQRFYTRWVALKHYCENTRSHLKQIRSETETWYVDNPRPKDAVKKAWDTASQIEDDKISKVIKDRGERMRMLESAATAPTNNAPNAITY